VWHTGGEKIWWRELWKTVLCEKCSADGRALTMSKQFAEKHFDKAERWIRCNSFGKTWSHVCKVFSSTNNAYSLIQ
jgi:hypothetical protein